MGLFSRASAVVSPAPHTTNFRIANRLELVSTKGGNVLATCPAAPAVGATYTVKKVSVDMNVVALIGKIDDAPAQYFYEPYQSMTIEFVSAAQGWVIV